MASRTHESLPPPVQILMRIALRPGIVLTGRRVRPELALPDVELYEATVLERTETGVLIGFRSGAAFQRASLMAAEVQAAMPAVAVALHAPCAEPPELTRDILARIVASARPGETLATEAFWRLAKDHFTFEALPERLFRLGAPKAPPPDGFVGRAAELSHLQSCWETASRGRPLFISLQGEPGIGKSRLLSEFLARVVPDVRVCAACSRPEEQQRPYALLSSLIEAIGLTPGRLAHDLGPEGADLDYLLGNEIAGAPVQPRHRQFRAFRALNRHLRERFGATPTVLALEDLHWSDEASLAWLDSLVAELASTEQSPPWLFTITERGQEMHRRYAGMGLGAVAVDMAPLSEAEARGLLAELAPDMAPGLRTAVHDRAAGNPLYLREFAQLAQQEGIAERLPETVRWELQRRLEGRNEAERQVLEMAAILGTAFDQDLLSRLTDVTGFKQVLANLSGAGLLKRGAGSTAFTHQLLHEAAYEAIPVERRRALHAMVAHILVEGGDGAEVAHHLLKGPRPALARIHLLKAAGKARERQAHTEAKQLLLNAARAGSEADAIAHSIRLELAEVLLALGELEGARCEVLAVRPLIPDGMRLRLALVASQVDERRGDYSTAIAALHEGHASVDPSAREDRARLLLAEAGLYLRRGEFATCRELAMQALESLGVEPGPERALALSLKGIATYRLEGPERALPAYMEALALREEVGDPAAIAGSLSNLGIAYYELGRWDEAHACFEGALETFRSIGERWQLTAVLNNMGHLLLNRGRQEAAEGCYREALHLKREMGEEPGVAIALCNLGNALSRRAAHEEARDCLQEAVLILERLGEAETLAEIYQVYGILELAAGDARRARWLLERVLDKSSAVRREVPRAIALRGLSQLAAQEERWEEAREYARESVRLNDRLQNPLELGRSLVAWGRANQGLGDIEQAMDAMDKASVLFRQLGALPDMRDLVIRAG